MPHTLDLEGFLRAIATRSHHKFQANAADEFAEDYSSVVVDADQYATQARRDWSIQVADRDTERVWDVFRFNKGRFITLRLAVLGVTSATDALAADLSRVLADEYDLVHEPAQLWLRYTLESFGGASVPSKGADVAEVSEQLAVYRPNYVMVVDDAQDSLARLTSEQLVQLTKYANVATTGEKQRPYRLLFCTEQPMSTEAFAAYTRLCESMQTKPAMTHYLRTNIDELAKFIRSDAKQYATQSLSIAAGVSDPR